MIPPATPARQVKTTAKLRKPLWILNTTGSKAIAAAKMVATMVYKQTSFARVNGGRRSP